jgi:hypothetical protein
MRIDKASNSCPTCTLTDAQLIAIKYISETRVFYKILKNRKYQLNIYDFKTVDELFDFIRIIKRIDD